MLQEDSWQSVFCKMAKTHVCFSSVWVGASSQWGTRCQSSGLLSDVLETCLLSDPQWSTMDWTPTHTLISSCNFLLPHASRMSHTLSRSCSLISLLLHPSSVLYSVCIHLHPSFLDTTLISSLLHHRSASRSKCNHDFLLLPSHLIWFFVSILFHQRIQFNSIQNTFLIPKGN